MAGQRQTVKAILSYINSDANLRMSPPIIGKTISAVFFIYQLHVNISLRLRFHTDTSFISAKSYFLPIAADLIPLPASCTQLYNAQVVFVHLGKLL